MLQRSKSERFSGHSCASPKIIDFEGHFRSTSHPLKNCEMRYESNQSFDHPVFDSFTQQNSPNGYSKIEGFQSTLDRRTLSSDKNDTISVNFPPVRGRNTLFPTNESNTGVAQLNIPSFRLTSSRSLSSLRTKSYFHSPEVIKPIPSSYRTEDIGIALGSPTHCDDLEMKVPLVRHGIGDSYVNDCYRKSSTKDLKPKASKWKMFEEFFGGKKKEPPPVSAYYHYHGRPRPKLVSKSTKKATNVEKNKHGNKLRRKSTIQIKKVPTRPNSRIINSRSNPYSRIDGHSFKRSGAGNYDSLIDVEIPFTKMDRYSVILNEVKQNVPPTGQSPLHRPQTVSDKLKPINESFIIKEHEISKPPKHTKKSSSNSHWKLTNLPSFKEKTLSRTGSPIQQTSSSHRTPSIKSSACLSMPKSYAIDNKTNNNEKSGSFESRISNKHSKSIPDSKRVEQKIPQHKEPSKVAQDPMIGIPKDSFLDFGFSKLFIKDGYQDFFSSSSATKQFDSPRLRPQYLNYRDGPPSLSSISSSERSLSSSTSFSSAASPSGTTPLTSRFEEMKFPTPPISTTATTSYITPSTSVPTYPINSSMSNHNSKKSSMQPSRPRVLKKTPSLSNTSTYTKSCLKQPSYSHSNESKMHLTPFPSGTKSNPAKIAANAINSPLDAFAVAINEEIGRDLYKLDREGKLQQKVGGGTYIKNYKPEEKAILGPPSRSPNFVMVGSEQESRRDHSKSLDISRKDNENHLRSTGSISNLPSWNSKNSPVIDLAAVSVARGIVAREYRKSQKAAVERVSVLGSF